MAQMVGLFVVRLVRPPMAFVSTEVETEALIEGKLEGSEVVTPAPGASVLMESEVDGTLAGDATLGLLLPVSTAVYTLRLLPEGSAPVLVGSEAPPVSSDDTAE